MDIKAAFKRLGLGKMAAAAEKVLPVWQKLDPECDYQAASLASKLSLLCNPSGDHSWWRLRQDTALEAVARVLGVPVSELLPRSDDGVVVEALPELRPLESWDTPCAVGQGGWLGNLVAHHLARHHCTWLVAPPGMGKSLVVSQLQRHHAGGVHTRQLLTLAELPREVDPSVPLVVEVDLPGGEAATATLRSLARRDAHTVVLAGFDRPSVVSGIVDARFALKPDWRSRLVRWTAERLSPEPSWVEDVLQWLGTNDPRGELFTSPGDLLTFLRAVHDNGGLKKKPNLRTWAQQHHGRVLGLRDRWLALEGEKLVEQLLRARLEQAEVPLGPLSVEGWTGLVPKTWAGAEITSGDILKLAGLGTAAARKKEGEALADRAKPPAEGAVHQLVEAGTLRCCSAGLSVYPRWAAVAIEQAVLNEKTADIQRWGAWAVDASRRALTDQWLDARPPHELLELVEKALPLTLDALGHVGAIEALFHAVGRRLLLGWQVPERSHLVLQRLGILQLDLLRRFESPSTPLPLTRRPDHADRAAHALWLAAAWQFSLSVPRPERVQGPGWWLPGWNDRLALADFPRNMDVGTARGGPLPEHQVWMLVAAKALEKCRGQKLPGPHDVPACFWPWLFITGWPVDAQYWSRLHQDLRRIFPLLLAQESSEVQVATVARCWAFELEHQKGDPIVAASVWQTNFGEWADTMLALIDPGAFEDAFRESGCEDKLHSIPSDYDALGGNYLEYEAARRLPPALKRALLRGLSKDDHEPKVNWLEHFLPELDTTDLDLLVTLSEDRRGLGQAAASRVWQLSIDRGREELVKSLDRAHSLSWILSAPRDEMRNIVHALGEVSSGQRRRMRERLMELLPVAGPAAPGLYALLHRDASGDQP